MVIDMSVRVLKASNFGRNSLSILYKSFVWHRYGDFIMPFLQLLTLCVIMWNHVNHRTAVCYCAISVNQGKYDSNYRINVSILQIAQYSVLNFSLLLLMQ